MHMQVILDSSFRSPGFSPYMGREEKRVQGLGYKAPGDRSGSEDPGSTNWKGKIQFFVHSSYCIAKTEWRTV